MKRLGVLGTMVWDTIHGRDPLTDPVEEWGGIAYALAAFEAALPVSWEIVPLIKVGKDLAAEANRFLHRLTRRAGAARFVEAAEPNNRVTLRYREDGRRAERLTGGVPPWTWPELGPMVHDLDALYVNFISGFEMDLATTTYLRQGFDGPIYADLHSLFLGVAADGLRVPRPLEAPDPWLACFDIVQINEDEFALLGPDPMEQAAAAMRAGVRLLLVTMGPAGAVYFTTTPFDIFDRARGTAVGPVHTARIPSPDPRDSGDPTGCGDVFGATMLSQLVDGTDVVGAVRAANAAAGRNLSARGATNLHYHLQGAIGPR